MNKRTGIIFAEIGGTLGIISSLGLFVLIKGILTIQGISIGFATTPFLGITDPELLLILSTIATISIGSIGIIAALYAKKNAKVSALLMIATGLAGFLTFNYVWTLSGILLIVGGIITIKKEEEEEEGI